MAHITIDLKPYSGEYPLELEEQPFTTLEWRWIKQLSGYLPLTVEQGFEGLDPDLFVALAVIALHRNGKIMRPDVTRVAERLSDAPFGATIKWVDDDVDPDADEDADGGDGDPPADAEPETSSPSASGGPSSTPLSDPSEDLPSSTGAPA